MSDFTAIPLSISFSPHTGLEREKGGIEECIDRLLELIVFTPKGSFSADPEFGFEYWNHEFSNLDVREFNNSYLDLMGAARRPGGITRRKCENSTSTHAPADATCSRNTRCASPSPAPSTTVSASPAPTKSA